MKIPTVQGIIKRRILVNYRVEPSIIQKILPARFRPKLHREKAIAGICLIRLEHIRPKLMPEFIGISSENAAHRIAVLWEDETGETREGVFVPRRDTDSLINTSIGGKIFSGEYQKADFEVKEFGGNIDFAMKSKDGKASVELKGATTQIFPKDSVFSSLEEASIFFEKGSLGYSVAKNPRLLDGIKLQIKNWEVSAFELSSIYSSFYDNKSIFSNHSIEFDHALLMRNILHEWHNTVSFRL